MKTVPVTSSIAWQVLYTVITDTGAETVNIQRVVTEQTIKVVWLAGARAASDVMTVSRGWAEATPENNRNIQQKITWPHLS